MNEPKISEFLETDEQVYEILKSAFLPLTCIARLHDADSKIQFTVIDQNNKNIFEYSTDTTEDTLRLHDVQNLHQVILLAREIINNKGYSLESFEL